MGWTSDDLVLSGINEGRLISTRHHLKPRSPPRRCLFCDGVAASAEHIWPKWAAPYFKRTAHDKSLESWHRLGAGQAKVILGNRVRHGHTSTVTVKAVCKACNNGWMSGLENAAKSALEPMLSGRRVRLSAADQSRLAAWVMLKAMVLGETDEKAPIFTREETLVFARDRSVPQRTNIWLFRSADAVRRARVTMAFAHVSDRPVDTFVRANVQTILIRIGRLVVFVSHTKSQLEPGGFRQTLAKALWPPRGQELMWPPINVLGRQGEDEIAGHLDRFLHQGRGWFWHQTVG